MAQNHPIMQQLQQLLGGTMGPPAQTGLTAAPNAGRDTAPLGQMPAGGGFAGTSPLAPPSPNLDATTMDRPKTPGGFAGTSPLLQPGASPQAPSPAMGQPQTATSPGNFNYMDILRNAQHAASLPRRDLGDGGGLY